MKRFEFTVDGVRYSVNDDNKTVTVVGNPSGSKPTGDLTIPGSVTFRGISFSVTKIGTQAFSGCSGLTSIKVESGNSVYDSHENCNAIIETATNILISGCKNTIIPNSVTSIGPGAFDGCSGLTSVIIGNSVTSIDNSAYWC